MNETILWKEIQHQKAGIYLVTICTQGKQCLFGNVENGSMKLNRAGRVQLREADGDVWVGGKVVGVISGDFTV